jgi:membrane fusion protein, multidrug efflux system
MAKRIFITLVVVVLILGALGFIKFKQIKTAMAAGGFTPPPESVTSTVAKRELWPSNLNAIGTVVAVQGVTVSADLPGKVDKIHFQSGEWVKQGDVLVELDTVQERAELASAEAQRDLSHINFSRMKDLVGQGVISRQEYDQATAQQKQGDAGADQIRATIARKTIRAPFSGLLGLRQVNLGQYLAAGDPIVTLQSLDPIYVNFNVPQESANQIQIGRVVKFKSSDSTSAEFAGKVTAVNAIVDPATRNVEIQATVPNPKGKLRPGMYVETQTSIGQDRPVIALPATAINYAPYGDSVFIVEEMKDPKTGKGYKGVKQQFVKVERTQGDLVAVVSGLNGGEEVVTGGVFKLRPNAAVQVNNKITPPGEHQPKPEDN